MSDTLVRASASLDELRSSLKGNQNFNGEFINYKNTSLEDSLHKDNDFTYKSAADHLSKLISHQDSLLNSRTSNLNDYGISNKMPPRARPLFKSSSSKLEEDNLVDMFRSQNSYIQMLEAENKFVREENLYLVDKSSSLVVENQSLTNDLKSSLIYEFHKMRKTHSPTFHMDDHVRQSSSMENIAHFNGANNHSQRFENEIKRIKEMHDIKNSRLETQLKQMREEMSRKESELEKVQVRLRQSEALQAQSDSGSVSTSKVQHLVTEREELLDAVTQLKLRVETMRGREQELCEQLSHSLETVEEAKLEETRAMVQARQLAEELDNLRSRFEDLVLDGQRRVEEERRLARLEVEREVDDLRRHFVLQEEKSATRDSRFETLQRSKSELAEQNEALRAQLRTYEADFAKSRDDMAAQATRAALHRDQAVTELQQMRERLNAEQRERVSERNLLKSEVSELRDRLTLAENGVMHGNEERLRLINQMQALERELAFARISRDSVERGREEELNTLRQQNMQREHELHTHVAQLETRHEVSVAQLNELLGKHSGLAQRLREELRRSAQQMEQLRERYSGDLERVRWERDQALDRAERHAARLADLEKQVVEHGRAHQRAKERLKQQDTAAQQQNQQMLELLAKNAALMRDRHMLAKEVDFLRLQSTEATPYNLPDSDKRLMHTGGLVNAILEEARKEHLSSPSLFAALLSSTAAAPKSGMCSPQFSIDMTKRILPSTSGPRADSTASSSAEVEQE